MHALPAAPAPPPRRQLLVGTSLACIAGTMLVGSMLATWILQRERAIDATGAWLPDGITIPEVATNVMLISFATLCLFAQWAVYAGRRGDRVHTGLALGLVGMLGLAIINAQAYVWRVIELPVADGAYGSMFYAVTGTILALVVIGLIFTLVAAFRFLGGRTSERELLAAHALYWYFVTAAFSAVWLVVYVTK